ncbi:hypothetical protein PQ478_08860 [Alkalihalophilus pseudofirmus]|uniref:hypothetical protein n=1 Tax=Alkalihalophilus pseudofirmus TaxID=79885 RepID=UPI00259B8A8A|nr:hypothetical protein [Alkalihalophilus pseudofirmus]WEG18580.1 hypothetical protein PQ478_08860 [Alkalihalophilus pseudofirmus]
MKYKAITVWSVITEFGVKLNHIEDGWVNGDKPQPIKKEFTNQLAWQNLKWKKEHKILNEKRQVVSGIAYWIKE